MAKSPITVKPGAEVSGIPQSQLEDMAASLQVDLRAGDKLVFYGPKPPFDRSTPWQLVNASGRPEGGIRYYDTNSAQWEDVTGATGPIGPAGPAGPTGATGPAGATGPTGPTGLPGATGPIGITGLTGAVGPVGPSGPIGLAGPVGPAGDTGNQGPIGQTGPIGPAGPAGPAGASGWLTPLDLAGSTLLVLSSIAYDTFTANRTFAVLPIPTGDYGIFKLQVEAAAPYDLDFHTNNVGLVFQRNVVAPGGLNPLTVAVTVPSGFTVLTFEYINSKWMLELS